MVVVVHAYAVESTYLPGPPVDDAVPRPRHVRRRSVLRHQRRRDARVDRDVVRRAVRAAPLPRAPRDAHLPAVLDRHGARPGRLLRRSGRDRRAPQRAARHARVVSGPAATGRTAPGRRLDVDVRAGLLRRLCGRVAVSSKRSSRCDGDLAAGRRRDRRVRAAREPVGPRARKLVQPRVRVRPGDRRARPARRVRGAARDRGARRRRDRRGVRRHRVLRTRVPRRRVVAAVRRRAADGAARLRGARARA